MQFFHCFALYNDSFIHEQIQPEPCFHFDSVIDHWDRYLPPDLMASLLQLVHQADFIDTFQQPWTQVIVHGEGRVQHRP